MERGGVEETRAETVRRRLRTIPSRVLGFLLVTVLLPVLLVVAVVIDALRRVGVWRAADGRPACPVPLGVPRREVAGVAALATLWVASLGRSAQRLAA